MNDMLNPDVTVRTKGIIEKCTFCLQRIQSAKREAVQQRRELADGDVSPACVQSCPTNALVFGNLNDDTSNVSQLAKSNRGYYLLEDIGTDPSVVYLKKVDPHADMSEEEGHD
jgi:molybdopterin-containing oxidoreductase family iron-sulfur binding subunit